MFNKTFLTLLMVNSVFYSLLLPHLSLLEAFLWGLLLNAVILIILYMVFGAPLFPEKWSPQDNSPDEVQAPKGAADPVIYPQEDSMSVYLQNAFCNPDYLPENR